MLIYIEGYLTSSLQIFLDSTVLLGNMSSPAEISGDASREHYLLLKQNGDAISLARAVQYAQDAVDLTPEGNSDRARYLGNLSICLSTRYEVEGKLDDINKATKYSQGAVILTPEGSSGQATCLNNLSNRLNLRYKREKKLDDINQAIKYGQDAIFLTSDGSPD